ncbi:MAG: tRNA (adenosine(37)-N6)-threonylcarbamoyltransferase complex ATPase subunit type 1 TsaE [Bacteroidales bacterium]|nr:tRNA (adenosine(37)-N6)-threonylcarbamoyltransferase complex ATPase subunit type 1 TsaE [Bacteroidales bacterium]
MKTYTAKSTNDLNQIAKEILANYPQKKIFALYGKMGSGKTTFIKEICKILGVTEVVTSPTFALINEYSCKNGINIFHFDFYRIKTQEEAYDFGYEEYFYDNNYCFIEWPELIENLLPETYVKITITEEENGNRIFNSEKINFS